MSPSLHLTAAAAMSGIPGIPTLPHTWRKGTALPFTELHCTALHCTALHCTALHCTALHCTALQYSAPHCTALNYTALHCTALHCTALHCTALHCTALHCPSLPCTAVHCIIWQGGNIDISSAQCTAQLPREGNTQFRRTNSQRYQKSSMYLINLATGILPGLRFDSLLLQFY